YFSLSSIWDNVPLGHLIGAFHSVKTSASASIQSLQRDSTPEHELLITEPTLSLRDLGLTDLRPTCLNELVNRLLPSFPPEQRPRSIPSCSWKASHISTESFFKNKHGENVIHNFGSAVLCRQRTSPLLETCSDLQHLSGWIQRRGFKTLKSRTRRLQAGYEVPTESEGYTPGFMKGVEEAKNELQEVCICCIFLLCNGAQITYWILLVGPPGTGKTLLARAVAGEADVPFYYASGSEFDEMFVGVGASRIRNLFKEAKANAPCVIFIDELDSVGGKRIESPMHPYSRQTINQLLAEMDGFKPNEGIIIIGATNFPEALDNALVRPGRFDMQVTVPRPDVKGRTEILNWYLKKIKVASTVEAEIIARGTVGFSGAELENLVNQAALKAAVDGKDMVTMKELEFAKDKILMGPERRSVQIDKKNKTITAYHESGHAIVAYYTKDAMPINKATIMPRGPTLGHVSMLPENDRWSETRSQLLAQMDVSMGGRVAEELIFGNENITTGASSDFDGATKIANLMVTRFGMSDKLGVMTYTDLSKHSPETQAAIEQEVRKLLKDSYDRAKNILKTYSKEHKILADALLRYETLDAKEIQMVLEGKGLEAR
uniref:ATP-dependent zinc metalloprotease YME1L1 n=1 Tax=Scleropages formosus TaxID=113540 RepID=A0A8C9SS26_SCLFO